MALPAHGVEKQTGVLLEPAFDTPAALATTNGCALIDLEVQPSQEWHPSQEHLGTASLTYEVEGKQGGRWSAKAHVKTRAAGTAPDVAPYIQAAMGSRTGSAFALSTALNSLQQYKYVGPSLAEMISGSWVESMEIECTGNQEPTLSFGGGFASYGGIKGGTTILTSGTALTAQPVVTLAAGNAYKIRRGALVAFGLNDNAGLGYRVLSVSASGLVITLATNLTAQVDAATAVTAHVPAFSLGGTIQGGIACGLSIDGVALGFISYKLSLQTGIHGLDKEANVNRVNRLARGKRTVTGTIQFYALDENIGYEAAAWNGTLRSIVFRAGPDTADNRLIVTTPAARLAIAEMKVPDTDETMYEATFVARRSAANDDELTVETT